MEEVYLAPQRVLGRWHDVTNKEGNTAVTPCIAYMGQVDANHQLFSQDEVTSSCGYYSSSIA
eukprot:m.58225 g.58225  ORF g.58225 m.58225 type:complete len:62 (+) comp13756_c1_seq4:1711-1896(+)